MASFAVSFIKPHWPNFESLASDDKWVLLNLFLSWFENSTMMMTIHRIKKGVSTFMIFWIVMMTMKNKRLRGVRENTHQQV
jgi:hypothetical protein